ncbi:DNA polymerase delta small subunit [Pyrus ussuriensis x Pyrus communis]|uniref:DNA polymerase delta small subunit n=1 Tax=Pyrus ussuriensis x Pyrus communis TaxID=2448454 RepID=A0A5N5FY93_9ROSA|nr:DNA polymerase delta small subunit [Pyrus ussuriensis x Pyrus communis]
MEAMKIDSEKNLHRKFEIQKEMYRGQQYSQIYFARLHMMRTLLYSLVPNWKPHLPVCRVLRLERDKECIIVGTLYKRMKLKLCVLDEYSKMRTVTPLVKPHNFVHPDDHLILEDESGRVKLSGNVLSPSVYVTGTIVGLHGKETDAGDFLVLDVLEAGLPPQIELPLKSSIAAQIVHVVIAGNSIEVPRGLLNGQNLASKDQSRLSEPIKELDILLTQVSTDKLDFIERTLRWRHLAPTAPNTLGSEGQMVRLIRIPKFCETGVAVVLNLGNHECHTLSFGTQFSS